MNGAISSYACRCDIFQSISPWPRLTSKIAFTCDVSGSVKSWTTTV